MKIKSVKWSHVYEYRPCGLILLGQNLIKDNLNNLKENINCESTCCVNDDSREDTYVSYPQQSSEVQQSKSDSDNTITATNVQFNDEAPGETVNIPMDLKAEAPYVPSSAELAKFLNRPVLIKQYTWTVGSTTVDSFFPWQLYFNHTSIKKKIDNYYLLRCKLKLKFVINASPFYYGTMLAAYKPLQSWLTPAPVDNISTGTSDDVVNVALSQLPRIYLYPQTSQGGEMTLPFLYPKEWLDITTSSNTSAMGLMLLRPLTPLNFANSGTGTPVTIQVFAWAEDVELSGPTVRLAMQSGKDEYGAISGPASAVANMAGMLEEAPVIGPYATATRMIANTTADVARMFGYTNVPVISDVHSFTPQPFPQNASPEIGTAVEKLTLDPKNELTIDSRAVGLDTGDELLISNITNRESYITQFPWAISNSVDDILFSANVTPQMERTATGVNQTIVQMTPMALVARMFAFWRGDIKFRFKFNCSQYHKGRVRISWDPVGSIGSTANSTTEVYTRIVDLSDSTDVTINIPYMQETAFCNRTNTIGQRFANDGTRTRSAGFDNGVLTVRVLTDLSAPLNTADVQVLVFVSGGDNLEFAAPTDIEMTNGSTPITAYPAQSKFEHYDVNASMVEMGESPSKPPSSSYLTYHGEVVKSLRTLIRRYGYYTAIPVNPNVVSSTADNFFATNRISRYPCYPGYATSNNGLFAANSLTTGTYRYNFVKWHPLTWLSQCFLGCRGAINYRFNVNNKLDIAHFSVVRSPLSTVAAISNTPFSGEATSATSILARVIPQYPDFSGMSITNTKTNTGLNVSVPYYSKYKFRTTSSNFPLGSSNDDSNLDYVQLQTILNPKADSNATSTYSGSNILIYMGAGTDYTPIFFCNVPTLYVYTSLPTSA